MSLHQELTNWDGKSANDIGEIYERHASDKTLLQSLIDLLNQEATQKGATWLIKHSLENNKQIDQNQTKALFSNLDKLKEWESKLHLLQILAYLTIDKPDKKKVEHFLRICLTDTNKFIRAWAYNGFYELAKQYPEYKEETKQFFEMAMKDEAPSVKSRIRNIMKQGF